MTADELTRGTRADWLRGKHTPRPVVVLAYDEQTNRVAILVPCGLSAFVIRRTYPGNLKARLADDPVDDFFARREAESAQKSRQRKARNPDKKGPSVGVPDVFDPIHEGS